jgi:hypothetical protein
VPDRDLTSFACLSSPATFFGYARNGMGRTARGAGDRSMEGSFALSVRVQAANDDDRASRMVRALLANGAEEQLTEAPEPP